ncbi:RNA polymerase subunit sigma, partial [Brucella sp. BTU2]|nr:RNA polymerase subunit sigma [Ochrobactrum sp. BTU2]
MQAQELAARWQEMELEWDALALLVRRTLGTGMVEPRAYNKVADDKLLFWSAQGDRRAFDEIVVRHGAFVLSVASRITPNFRDAED